MIGDKLIVTAYHRGAAARVLDSLKKRFWNRPRPVAITVAGESGSDVCNDAVDDEHVGLDRSVGSHDETVLEEIHTHSDSPPNRWNKTAIRTATPLLT